MVYIGLIFAIICGSLLGNDKVNDGLAAGFLYVAAGCLIISVYDYIKFNYK